MITNYWEFKTLGKLGFQMPLPRGLCRQAQLIGFGIISSCLLSLLTYSVFVTFLFKSQMFVCLCLLTAVAGAHAAICPPWRLKPLYCQPLHLLVFLSLLAWSFSAFLLIPIPYGFFILVCVMCVYFYVFGWMFVHHASQSHSSFCPFISTLCHATFPTK